MTSCFEISDLPFFKRLPAEDISALIQNGNIKNYSKHSSIFLQGENADRFFAVLEGWIKLYRSTNEGAEAIVTIFTKGDVFGEAAIFGSAGYPFSAEAVEDAKIFEIPASVLKERARINPEITTRIMNSMSREMHKLQMENEHMAVMSAAQRVGCLLLQLSSGMIGNGGRFSFPYDKSLAATRLGMKPETFSRALSQLKSLGVSTSGSEIEIQSFHCLAKFCCGDCSAEETECLGARHNMGCRQTCCPSK